MLAVIPARGGSKRIPRKNIRHFCGKPIIAYSIEAAHGSGLFDRVIVSTDDEEIADTARRYGADVPFLRPAALSDDHAGTNSVVKHALQAIGATGRLYDYACCIYATAPLLQIEYLIEGLRRLKTTDKSYAFSVTTYDYPVQRALRLDSDGSISPHDAAYAPVRSQDLELLWHDAAQFYWGRAAAFLNDVALFSAAAIGVPIPPHLVQDIDTLEDWQRAELMYAAYRQACPGSS